MEDKAKGEVDLKKILAGHKVAVLVESEFIPEEIQIYKKRFTELGAEVHFVSRLWGYPSARFVSDVDQIGKPLEILEVHRDLKDCRVSDYSAIIMAANYTSVRLRMFNTPEGVPVNPEMSREAPAVRFFAEAMKNPRVIKGALCHGLWILSPNPELIRGRRVICHEVMVADVRNMGAIYVPSKVGVIVDGDLVSGHSKDEVPLFVDTIAQLVERVAKGQRLESYETQAFQKREGQLKVHVVLSSFGFWGEELVAPVQEFEKAGIDWDYSTPYGHPPRVVGVSMDPDYVDPPLNRKVTSCEMAKAVREMVESDRLNNPRKVGNVHLDEFDALLLVGGSGPVLDMNNCRDLQRLIYQCYAANKLVAAECYAVAALAFSRVPGDSHVRSVIWGKRVTGHPIPHDYTTEYGYEGVTPAFPFIGPAIPLEYVMRDAVGPDGEFRGNLDKEISVEVDLPFITSRSVAESRECGRQLVKHLKERHPRR
ncbi:MAG: DJ-1/PfpI family protein [Isosphaeraceae bacterium]|jgi:putative intracellular protease/amidase